MDLRREKPIFMEIFFISRQRCRRKKEEYTIEKRELAETLCDNYANSALRRECLNALLNTLETKTLCETEREAIAEKAQHLIDELKREREQMVLYMAQESVFVDEAQTRLHEIMRVSKAKKRAVHPAPTNAQIDAAEKRLHHFAQGKSFYKLFWVFFIGCFAGVMVERLWALIRFGVLEPRVGLVYGPFNLVYGIGAWALTAALYPFRNRSRTFSFLGGMIIGSVVEYACSLFQELVFGSVSWDYSARPFNLHGRICLLYSVYWGILGVCWIKEIYPRMAQCILRIPNCIGKPLTLVLCAFMLFNTAMTGASMFRWTQRREGKAAQNRIEAYLDRHYPDERMEKIFSNLEFVD